MLMGFNPGTGMTPNDWAETEARRAERTQRADRPHGREISPRSRRITGFVIAVIAVALMAYALLGWLGVVAIPGFTG
jgi:cytochrome c-type biogenesis protein CcmH/NrfG